MPPYRLFGRRQTGSMAVEAVLAEAGIAHDAVPVARPKTNEEIAAFAAINPRLQVPVLIHPDGTVITEGPAILTHLADAHPQAGLIPKPGSAARARHDRWLAFFQANVYEGMLRELFAERYTSDRAGAEPVARAATAYVRRHFEIFEPELGPGPYLAGSSLSVFDIYLWMLCHWIDEAWLLTRCPAIARLASTASARPALARVAAAHFDAPPRFTSQSAP